MTTTLRPLTPEQPAPDGGRGRLFAVCVNGRPVGRVTVTAHVVAGGGPWVGEITALGIDPADRGRGRGTVAALAAEEVLRGWGCVLARAVVEQGPGQPAALRLAEALGYRVRARYLAKSLPDGLPELPPGVHGRPLTAEEFPDWLAAGTREHVDAQISRGLTPEQARAVSAADHRYALPYGLDSPHTVLRVLRSAGQDVGSVWVDTDLQLSPDAQRLGWVFDVRVAPEHRGRGYGRALMLLAERECLDIGVRRLGLNVLDDNVPANALYRSLGYRTTRHILEKQL